MAQGKVIVVTGANRGIGHAICEKLLSHSTPPSHLYACSRSGQSLSLQAPSTTKVHYHALDISSSSSIAGLAKTIKSSHPSLDILINNAGTNDMGPNGVSQQTVVDVNYKGTRDMCLSFLPLLTTANKGQEGGRIVNVSSVGSDLSNYSPQIAARFRDPKMTLSGLEDLVNEFETSIKSGQQGKEKAGFGGASGYCFSKASINALTAILGRENAEKGVLINCCCPGWVDTDMGGIMGKPPKTMEEGARIPVRLAVGDLEGVTGRYWSNPNISDSGEGSVTEW